MRARLFAVALTLLGCSVPDKQPVGADGGIDAPPGDVPEDPTAPDTMITAAPGEFSPTTASTFSFTSSKPNSTFACSIDGDTPVACESPYTRTLNDGTHSFSVRAVDGTGNSDDTPAEMVWTIDTVVPETMMLKAPPAADNSTMVTFTFRATEENVVFECRLDNGAYAPCESGQEFGPIGDGAHAFAVRARDRAGNTDASAAVHAWSVDTSTPDTQLISAPEGANGSTTATFSFISPDAGAGATFQCALDGAAFVDCASPREVTGLTEGVHTFAVRVRDSVGNFDPTPATRTWTVDLSPPETTIDMGPMGMEATASGGFVFSSNELNVTFACSLDGAAFTACTSPVNLTSLGQGNHTFAVKAIDMANHEDPTPATRAWTVDTVAPNVAIVDGPAEGSVVGPRVTFTFTVSDGATQCAIDGAPFACTSPTTMQLRAGPHTFAVTSTDGAGNMTTATRSFTVGCAAPDAAGAAGLLHLDDNGQTLANATGGAPATLGTDATVEVGDPTFVTGRFAGGLAFTAAEDDHVAWPIALAAMPELTIELWARADALAGDRDLLSTADGRVSLRVAFDSASTVIFRAVVIDGGGVARIASSAAVPVAAWHRIVMSLQEPILRLWVDDIRTEAGEITLGTAPALDAIRIGGTGASAYSGLLDEVRVSQTAVTSDDAALAGYCPP